MAICNCSRCLVFLVFVVPALVANVMLDIGTRLDVLYLNPATGSFVKDKYEFLKTQMQEADCVGFHTNRPENDISSEDILLIGPNQFIYATGDLHQVFHHGTSAAKHGSFFVAEYDENDNVSLKDKIKIRKLNIEGYEVGSQRRNGNHYHGLYYSKMSNRLYAVNHLGLEEVGTVIDIFEIVFEGDKVTHLKYLATLDGNWGFGVLNDLVENGPNEFFVTQWSVYPFPLKGSDGKGVSIREHVNRYIDLVTSAFIGWRVFARNTFYVCRYSLNGSKPSVQCADAKEHLGYYMHASNGIAIDRSSSKIENFLYVNDVTAKLIFKYSVPKSFAHLHQKGQIKEISRITVPDGVDNINYDEERNLIVGAGMPQLLKAALSFGKEAVPGSLILVNPEETEGKRTLIEAGNLLSQVSGCWLVDENHVIFGSPFDEGILLCEFNRN